MEAPASPPLSSQRHPRFSFGLPKSSQYRRHYEASDSDGDDESSDEDPEEEEETSVGRIISREKRLLSLKEMQSPMAGLTKLMIGLP